MLWLDQWTQVFLPLTMILLSNAIFYSLIGLPTSASSASAKSTVLESGKDFTGPCHIMFTHEDASADAYQQHIDAGGGSAVAGHMGVSRGRRLSYFPRISFNATNF